MISHPDDGPARWSNAGFARIVRLASDRAGLTFPENRRDITESALRRAMTHAGVRDPGAFAERVASSESAFNDALMELTVGETYFFRDPGQWDLVRQHIVPELLQRHPDGRGARVWSAGCASGEEAYTLGIVLRDAGCIDPMVTGTDLCEHRLARASRGVYTKWSLRGMDDERRHRYFHEGAQHFTLRPEYRDAHFRPLNLASPSYGLPGQDLSELDLILCRNVLIYIDPVTVSAIFARLASALREGGWLMVAASDPQPDAALGLDVVLTDAGLLYRRPTVAARGRMLAAKGSPDHQRAPSRTRVPARKTPPRARPVIARALEPVSGARSRTEQVVAAYRAGDYTRVVALAEEAIAAKADDAAVWVALARAHANRGDAAAAAAACARGIVRHPADAELHVVESALEFQRDRFTAAAEAARRALYLDRTLAVAQLALGVALMRSGDALAADRALRAAERMLAELTPGDAVRAGDGATAAGLTAATQSHRALLQQRGSRAS